MSVHSRNGQIEYIDRHQQHLDLPRNQCLPGERMVDDFEGTIATVEMGITVGDGHWLSLTRFDHASATRPRLGMGPALDGVSAPTAVRRRTLRHDRHSSIAALDFFAVCRHFGGFSRAVLLLINALQCAWDRLGSALHYCLASCERQVMSKTMQARLTVGWPRIRSFPKMCTHDVPRFASRPGMSCERRKDHRDAGNRPSKLQSCWRHKLE